MIAGLGSRLGFGLGPGLGRESDLTKMVTFMNMIITGVENGSPDMILVAFEGKFDEKQK